MLIIFTCSISTCNVHPPYSNYFYHTACLSSAESLALCSVDLSIVWKRKKKWAKTARCSNSYCARADLIFSRRAVWGRQLSLSENGVNNEPWYEWVSWKRTGISKIVVSDSSRPWDHQVVDESDSLENYTYVFEASQVISRYYPSISPGRSAGRREVGISCRSYRAVVHLFPYMVSGCNVWWKQQEEVLTIPQVGTQMVYDHFTILLHRKPKTINFVEWVFWLSMFVAIRKLILR